MAIKACLASLSAKVFSSEEAAANHPDLLGKFRRHVPLFLYIAATKV